MKGREISFSYNLWWIIVCDCGQELLWLWPSSADHFGGLRFCLNFFNYCRRQVGVRKRQRSVVGTGLWEFVHHGTRAVICNRHEVGTSPSTAYLAWYLIIFITIFSAI